MENFAFSRCINGNLSYRNPARLGKENGHWNLFFAFLIIAGNIMRTRWLFLPIWKGFNNNYRLFYLMGANDIYQENPFELCVSICLHRWILDMDETASCIFCILDVRRKWRIRGPESVGKSYFPSSPKEDYNSHKILNHIVSKFFIFCWN